MDLSPQFIEAASDYLYLLEKNFPQKAIIKLIGDRYSLSGVERTMLYRGLTTTDNKSRRSVLLIDEDDIGSKDLHIDGYNVLITIGTYLNGNAVFLSNDNYLRDASEVHGKVFRTALFDRSIQLILDYLIKMKVKSAQFYFDAPVSKSGILAAKVKEMLRNIDLPGDAITANSPDYILKNMEDGVVCTSDSTIIDHTHRSLFDLARQTISYHFKPNFLNLYREF